MYKLFSLFIFMAFLSSCKSSKESVGQNISASDELPEYVLDTLDSMVLNNEAPLLNASSSASWAKSGFVVQGIPRGDTVPLWWSEKILDGSIISDKPWNALTAWFTVFESTESQVQDADIYYSDFEVWLLKGQNIAAATWELLGSSPTTWASYYEPDIVTWYSDTFPNSSVGYYQFQHPFVLHGGTSKLAFDGSDVLGIFVRTKAWMESSSDEANLLMSIGVDYYPTVHSSVSNGDFANANYLPGAGGSRFARLESEPKWFYMANIAKDDLTNVDKYNQFYLQGGRNYLTTDEWKNNYPLVTK